MLTGVSEKTGSYENLGGYSLRWLEGNSKYVLINYGMMWDLLRWYLPGMVVVEMAMMEMVAETKNSKTRRRGPHTVDKSPDTLPFVAFTFKYPSPVWTRCRKMI